MAKKPQHIMAKKPQQMRFFPLVYNKQGKTMAPKNRAHAYAKARTPSA